MSAASPWVDAALSAGLLTLTATPLLAVVARRFGWVERREGVEERKPRRAPIPPVGGAALLLALLLAPLVVHDGASLAASTAGWVLPWPALAAAFVLGSLDDLLTRGLSVAAKLSGQAGVAALLAAQAETPREAALRFAVALVAQNAVNTFDNADGAAAGLGLAGLHASPLGCGALLGFLPWNLGLRRGGGERVPWAYLGDAGTHTLGVLIAATPSAWPVLLLPLLDLARLAPLRLRAGSRPWIGDRRHLAHRLAAAGLGRGSVAALLGAVAALPVLGQALAGPLGLAGGALGGVLCFLALVHASPDPLPAGPCSPASHGR